MRPVPWTERAHYRLGQPAAEVRWHRASPARSAARALRRRLPSPEKWLYRAGLRSAEGLALPDLLCIGAQKAATSWLHAQLARHPGANVPRGVKEVHYFDFLFHEPLAAYAALFEPGRARVKCDVTPNYGRLRPARIRFVRRVMPSVRLVFLLRNPVERAWSQAVMDLATRAGRPARAVPEAEWRAHLLHPANLRNGLQSRMLDAWLRVFPDDQLLVLFAEDAAARPRETLDRVFAHAGLAPGAGGVPSAGERVHAGPNAPLPECFRRELEAHFAEEIRALASRYGGPARDWLARETATRRPQEWYTPPA